MKVWITKYALTKGILEMEGEETISPSMICITNTQPPDYYNGKDWHFSKKKAIERANEMALNKINTLQQQIEKIKSLKFE